MDRSILYLLVTVFIAAGITTANSLPYTIVDTGQIRCYGNDNEIKHPSPGSDFFGQDAQYNGNSPIYKGNGDGTITDINTGLMWTQLPCPKAKGRRERCRSCFVFYKKKSNNSKQSDVDVLSVFF